MREKPRTNPLTGTVVMEPPREEAPPETVVVPTAVVATPPRPAATPFPMARPGSVDPRDQATGRDSKLPWRETRDDVKPAVHALSGTMVVEPPAPETVVLPAPPPAAAPAPAPALEVMREDLLPPKDPWGTALPAPAPAPAPPPPPEKRANPRTGMMKSFYDGKKG